MKQVAHILAKDVRRHWPEVAASLAVLALFGRTEAWRQSAESMGQDATWPILTLLVLVSWWVLITRVVQSESLVGDVQWWVTRPYEWGKLLAAKVLFLAVFVVLPLLLLQMWLLWDAGFSPWAHLGALALETALVAAALLLPFTALATVTSTFARMALTTLVVLVVIILGIVAFQHWESGRYAADWLQVASLPILLALGSAAIVLQYARRRAGWARGMLGAILAVWLACALASESSIAVAKSFPANAPKFSATLTATNPLMSYAAAVRPDLVDLDLIVRMNGLPDGRGVMVQAVEPTVIAADGRKWQGGWQPLGGERFIGRFAIANLQIAVDRAFYDAVRYQPVTLRLRLAAFNVEARQTLRMGMPGHAFAVAGVGICTPYPDRMGRGFVLIGCRSAVRRPPLTLVTAQWSDTPCGHNGSGTGGATGSGWLGELMPQPGSARLNPVIKVPLPLSYAFVPPKLPATGRAAVATMFGMESQRFLCVGTPLTFTAYRPVGRTQYDAALKDIQLPKEWDRTHPAWQ
jgi:hypothetical protein